ncbi:MAG: hypothetical protein NTV62_01775, partial [Candidatus Gribaldobacteria bacterium]|nr:hypothetical protein [Candidatus Gribaldobacteria bacterium]
MPLLTSNNNSFRSQRPDEKTILVVHRHWITLVGPFFFLFFFALLPFFVNGPIQQTSWYYDLADFYWFFITAYYLILWIAFFGNLMIYS